MPSAMLLRPRSCCITLAAAARLTRSTNRMKCMTTTRVRKFLVARPLKANSMLPPPPNCGAADRPGPPPPNFPSGNASISSQPIDAFCGAAEQHRLLVGRGAGCQAFEGVPQDRIARAGAVRRKVALEHRAIYANGGDAGFDIGPVSGLEIGRRRRLLTRIEVEHAKPHAEPAELDDDVLRLRDLGDAGLPLRKGLGFMVLVGSDPDRPADMVEDDRGSRKG